MSIVTQNGGSPKTQLGETKARLPDCQRAMWVLQNAVNRYQSIANTIVQLFVPQASGVMRLQQPDSSGKQHGRAKGEGS